MDNTIKITKEQLNQVMLRWEALYRAGETLTVSEALNQPAEQIAAESTEYLWVELQKNNS